MTLLQHRDDQAERLNRRGRLESREPGRPRRSRVVSLVLACLILMTLDLVGGESSPVEPARRLVGEAFGAGRAGVDCGSSRPFLALSGWFHTQDGLTEDVARLEADNERLRADLATIDYDRNRLAEYDGLTATADQLGYALVPARVIGIGAAQSFSSTVTIDAGTRAGSATGPDGGQRRRAGRAGPPGHRHHGHRAPRRRRRVHRGRPGRLRA